MKVLIEVSEPWDFITRKDATNNFEGRIIKENTEHTKFVVQLNEIINYKEKEFDKVICEVRYVNQKFNLLRPGGEGQICAITGIPNEYFDIANPFSYDMNTTVYLIGAITVKK